MNISAIIIDDEKNNRENLNLLLSQHCPEVNIISMAENAREGIKQIRNHWSQLIFLDIQMPGDDGFTVLNEIKPFIKRDSGSVVLNDGTTLLVSKNNNEELLQLLKINPKFTISIN